MIGRSEARETVWRRLRSVAKPDSRFHFDFGDYIPDFEGSKIATDRLVGMGIYQDAGVLFITPDNCLELLRAQTIRDGKTLLMATYGIRRGFIKVDRDDVPRGLEEYAVVLDVIERMGHGISLAEMRERRRIDLLVTGASAVARNGTRFGKGHGFFDLEWAMLFQIGVVDEATPVVAMVHDCQVVEDEVETTSYDTICDYIVTPSRVIEVKEAHKPTGGVLWDKLELGMMERISPLQELKQLPS